MKTNTTETINGIEIKDAAAAEASKLNTRLLGKTSHDSPSQMKTNFYNPIAKTPEEHAENCQFQLENILGWIEYKKDRGGDSRRILAKAECLKEAAEKLVESLKGDK